MARASEEVHCKRHANDYRQCVSTHGVIQHIQMTVFMVDEFLFVRFVWKIYVYDGFMCGFDMCELPFVE